MTDEKVPANRLRLVTFGGLSIQSEGGVEISGLLPRRQSLAVLAFLAANSAHAGVSRDRLCAIFWPESDTERARNALKQAIFSLRRDLKQHELVTGTTELRLNREVICSDVLEFGTALAARDFERAAKLYTGPFLEGLHLRNSPEFERWSETERARLADQAGSAMRAAARGAIGRGDSEQGITWLRRLAVLNPLDTEATIELMEALAHRGHRADALQQAKRHESYVRDELGAAPDRRIRELVAKISSREEPPATVATRVDQAPEIDATTRPELSAAPVLPRRRTLVLTAALFAVLIAAIWFGSRHAAGLTAAPHPAHPSVFVAPFHTDAGDSSIVFLRDGMVDLLSSTLTGDSLGPHSVDPATVFASVKEARMGSEDPSLQTLLEAARNAGATRMIKGGVIHTGDDVLVTATMFDVANGSSLGKADVSGNLDSLPKLVDKLAAQLIAIQMGERAVTEDLLAGTSLSAVKSYLAGRAAFRRGAYDDAVLDQKRALLTDSSFALAALELGRTAGWLGDDAARRWAYERAWVNRQKLRPLDQALITAMLGPRYPKGSSRAEWLSAWEHVAEVRPDEPEGWYEAGDLIFHNPWLGTASDLEGLARARTLFTRALERAPDYAPALQHLLQLAAHDRDTVTVRRLMANVQKFHLNRDLDNYLRWRAAISVDDSAGQRKAWARFQPEDLLALQWVAMTSEEDGIALEEAATALQVRLRAASTDRERVDALLALHALALNRGELRKAAQWTQTLMFNPLGADIARNLQVLDVIYGGMQRNAGTDAAIAEMEGDATARKSTVQAREQWSVDRCILGHWYLTSGEYAKVGRASTTLEKFGSTFPNELWSEGAMTCAELLGGFVAVHEQKRGVATLLQDIDKRLSSGAYVTSRLVWDISVIASARLFELAGDTADAQNAARRRNWFYRWPHYLARQLLELGRLSEMRGDVDTERAAYQHYLMLRNDPDPLLKAEVQKVQGALASLARQ